MDAKSEVLLRQYDYLSGRVLLINPPTDHLLAEFDQSIQAAVWTWNYNDYLYFQAQQANVHFGAEFPEGEFDQAVIFVPKSRELLNYLIHNVAVYLKQGSQVFLVGEKT
jgi:16S rRNA (guanine1207-N2)-methyltransferase